MNEVFCARTGSKNSIHCFATVPFDDRVQGISQTEAQKNEVIGCRIRLGEQLPRRLAA